MTTTPSDHAPLLRLRDQVAIPQLGFGVFQVPPADTERAVSAALSVGYRHIDTATAYQNEEAVGEAVRRSGLPRDQVFITTKCFNADHGYQEATRALHASLQRLGVEQVDLYLIHWPVPAHDRYADTWRALVDLQTAGLARSIGVSNFNPAHLRRIIDETGVVPSVNQIELHPRLSQEPLRRLHAELGIATEAWSPLARGALLTDAHIAEIASAHQRTPAQVILRWHLQIGNIVIPRSVTPARIEAHFQLFDFELSEDDMWDIDALNVNERIGPDPEHFVMPDRR